MAGGSVLLASDPIRAKSDATDDERWTHPDGNAAATAANVNGVGPTGEVSKAWESSVSGYFGDTVVGAVVDGTVYATGSYLYAIDAADGTTQWEFEAEIPDKEYPESPAADIESATVMDGVVYAPVRIGVYDGNNAFHTAVVAVDAETGEKLWRIDAPVPDAQFSSVTAVDGSLFVRGPDLDGGEGRFVYALDADDGSVRWRQSRGRETSEQYPPVVAEGLVFVSPPTGVKAYDAASGEPVWDALPRVKDLSVAMVSEGTLYVNENTDPGATIIALDATTGQQQWKTAYGGDVSASVYTVDTEQLYVSTTEEDGGVVALDRSTGDERWRTAITQPTPEEPKKRMPEYGTARVGELLYVGGAGLEPTDGSVVWKQEIEYSVNDSYSLDAVAGGRIYFSNGNMGGGLVVLEGTQP